MHIIWKWCHSFYNMWFFFLMGRLHALKRSRARAGSFDTGEQASKERPKALKASL